VHHSSTLHLHHSKYFALDSLDINLDVQFVFKRKSKPDLQEAKANIADNDDHFSNIVSSFILLFFVTDLSLPEKRSLRSAHKTGIMSQNYWRFLLSHLIHFLTKLRIKRHLAVSIIQNFCLVFGSDEQNFQQKKRRRFNL
jgi:hypothetical protein